MPTSTSSVLAPVPPLSTAERRRGFCLAIDPGLRAVGLALFRDGQLVRAGAVRGPPPPQRGPAAWSTLAVRVDCWVDECVPVAALAGPTALVVETMRYDHRSRKGSAEDLLEVQGVAGAVVGLLAADCWVAHEAPAHEWVRVPRDIFAARVEKDLRADGAWPLVEVPSRATELNDAMHAVGIGRWWLRL
jgi:hypothetical protein